MILQKNPTMYTCPVGFRSNFVRNNPAEITRLLTLCRENLGTECVPPDPQKAKVGCELVRDELSSGRGTFGGITACLIVV